jgi:hypothetical protein
VEAADPKALKRRRREAEVLKPTPAGPNPAPERWRWDLHRDFVPWVLRLPPREVAVWLALWNRSPHRRAPFKVGGTTLGRDCGLPRHHASAAAASLARRGLVEVLTRGSARTGEANTYRLPPSLPSPGGGTRASPDEA